jgi:hypothetical protein
MKRLFALAILGLPLTLQWDYDLSVPGNPPLKDYREYVLERSVAPDAAWTVRDRFPAHTPDGTGLVLERRLEEESSPWCYRLMVTAVGDGGAVVSSPASNVACVSFPVPPRPFPAPLAQVRQAEANTIDVALAWRPSPDPKAIPLGDLHEWVFREQCTHAGCGHFDVLITAPARTMKGALVKTRRLQIKTPRCITVSLTAFDRSASPVALIESPPSPPVCAP